MEPEALYTILPTEAVFPPDHPVKTELRTIRGRLCECVREGEGYAIRRLLSTNPADYLDPDLAPGTTVRPSFSD